MNNYLEQIHKFGLKDTKQRQQVYKCIKDSRYPLSAIEVYNILKDVDLATVHRTLNTFVQINLIEWNSFLDEEKKYSLKTKKHIHIITCKKCGKTAMFDTCFIKSFEKDILKKTGYKVLEHQIQFLGLCSLCRSK
jgi:Fur family transcriptional regulator, ferric uptake regulator